MRVLGPVLVALLAFAPMACDVGSGGEDRAEGDSDQARTNSAPRKQGTGAPRKPRAGTRAEPSETVPARDGQAVREWIEALDAGEYRRAASYFARGAIVQQADEFRLRDRRAAEIFNRGLPCRADLSDLDDEGRTVVGTFRLRDGPGGHCEGEVRVRFTIRHGRFVEWRQLGEPPGEIA